MSLIEFRRGDDEFISVNVSKVAFVKVSASTRDGVAVKQGTSIHFSAQLHDYVTVVNCYDDVKRDIQNALIAGRL